MHLTGEYTEGVYPRTGGGTAGLKLVREHAQGLSPHGRGNRSVAVSALRRRGSIPARAGEPPRRKRATTWPRVYPRTGGGTLDEDDVATVHLGLSPHGRGNPEQDADRPEVDGSIPARAGEPEDEPGAAVLQAVYPRTGGGTIGSSDIGAFFGGLSPHGRGNRDACDGHRRLLGSIPARAGEPSTRARSIGTKRVYPRTGGGTGVSVADLRGVYGLSPHGRGNL